MARTPEEIAKELEGKTPEQIAQILAQSEQELETQKSATAANAQRLEGLAKQVDEFTKKPVVVKTEEKQKERDWYKDPDAAASVLIDQKLGPYVNAFLSNVEVQTLQRIQGKEYYPALKDEIDAALASMTPEVKAIPGAVERVYDMVVGGNLTKVREFEQKKQERTAEFTETTSTAGARRKEEPKATAQQEEVAAGLGIPVKEYLKWQDDPDAAYAELQTKIGERRA